MPISWLHDAEQAKAAALQLRRPILIDVYKVPCRGCDRLDADTYPDAEVEHEVTTRFVPLKLHLFESPREVIRPLNVIWTPTILFADRRLGVHYTALNFLPPRHFLTLLDIGEAEVALRWSRTEQAIALLQHAYARDPEGPFAAEALYRQGIATYLLTHSNPQMYAIWDDLRVRFPDSIWAQRIP